MSLPHLPHILYNVRHIVGAQQIISPRYTQIGPLAMGRHSFIGDCEAGSWNYHWFFKLIRTAPAHWLYLGMRILLTASWTPIRNATYEPLGIHCLQIPPPGPQSLSTFCTSDLPHPPPCGQLPVCVLEGREWELRHMASEHAQKVGPKLWDWEKAYKLEHSAPPQGKQMEGCQHPA